MEKLSKQENNVGAFIYDANIYDGMNTSMDDLPFYKKWLKSKKDGRVLELCCGSGRLTIPLAQDGVDITGVDNSATMLEKARHKSQEKGLDIPFFMADMRQIDLNEQFDLIFIPFNSIHHLYENRDITATLQSVKKHLKKGGQFIFDCFNPDLKFIVENSGILNHRSAYTTSDGRSVVIKEIMNYQSNTQINHIKWHYYIDGVFHSIEDLDMRMYYPKELDAYLGHNGFEIVHKFGDFEEQLFGDHSMKQIFICR